MFVSFQGLCVYWQSPFLYGAKNLTVVAIFKLSILVIYLNKSRLWLNALKPDIIYIYYIIYVRGSIAEVRCPVRPKLWTPS